MPLNATPGDPNANSYATVQQADDYHADHLYGSSWTSAATATKEAALIWATRLLDEQVEWVGTKVTIEQALRWPRSDAWTPDQELLASDTIPIWLVRATAELARYLIQEDRTSERSHGLTRVKADVVEVEFDRHDERPMLPPSVRSLVGPYGSVKAASPGWAKLERA